MIIALLVQPFKVRITNRLPRNILPTETAYSQSLSTVYPPAPNSERYPPNHLGPDMTPTHNRYAEQFVLASKLQAPTKEPGNDMIENMAFRNSVEYICNSCYLTAALGSGREEVCRIRDEVEGTCNN